MRLNLLSDFYWETRVGKAIGFLFERGFLHFFENKEYGNSLAEIVVVFMCREPHLKFKQRIRYSRKEKIIYLDIMLDFDAFIKIDQDERVRIIAQRLVSEVPQIVAKYKLEDFDVEKLKTDLEKWCKKNVPQ